MNAEIKTNRLKVRPLIVTDVNKLFYISLEKGVKKWLPNHVYEDITQVKEVVKFLNKDCYQMKSNMNKPYIYGITKLSLNEIIGYVTLNSYKDSLEVQVVIESKEQNKGYGSEALKKWIEYCKCEFEINHLYAVCSKENENSIALLEKLEFRRYSLLFDDLVWKKGA